MRRLVETGNFKLDRLLVNNMQQQTYDFNADFTYSLSGIEACLQGQQPTLQNVYLSAPNLLNHLPFNALIGVETFITALQQAA